MTGPSVADLGAVAACGTAIDAALGVGPAGSGIVSVVLLLLVHGVRQAIQAGAARRAERRAAREAAAKPGEGTRDPS